MDVEQVKYLVTSSILVEVQTVCKVYYQTRQAATSRKRVPNWQGGTIGTSI